MRPFRSRRSAALLLTGLAALASSGCPELNRYPDRSIGPQFSIDDPAGRATSKAAPRQTGILGPTQVVVSETVDSQTADAPEGRLSDRSR